MHSTAVVCNTSFHMQLQTLRSSAAACGLLQVTQQQRCRAYAAAAAAKPQRHAWRHPFGRQTAGCTRARQPQRRRALVCSTASASAAASPAFEGGDGGGQLSVGQKLAAFRDAFWKFLRPHTIRGTILGATAVTARALLENQHLIDWGLLPRAALGVVALLAGNGYIVGINQVYDVELDTINKPFLPIAAGELSPALAWVLVVGLAAAGLTITSLNFGRTITALYTFGLFLGTIYSVPPFRLKRFAVPAFMIIATVRGFLLNFGVYYATRAAIGLNSFAWSPAIAFITVFVTVFATVIAITKDLADIEGDRQYNIQTFATRLGPNRLALLALGLLLSNYAGAAVLAVRLPHAFNVRLMIGAHAAFGLLAIHYTRRAQRAGFNRAAIGDFYKGVWTLFYSEYCLLPFL